MLYRHVQPLFLVRDWATRSVTGPRLVVRPMDGDTPDHAARFLVWAAVHDRQVRLATPGQASRAPAQTPAPTRPKLLLEVSGDGEGWAVVSTLEPRERPYLVTVPHMLRYVRMKLESSGSEAVAYGLVMANTPFELLGPDPRVSDTPSRTQK